MGDQDGQASRHRAKNEMVSVEHDSYFLQRQDEEDVSVDVDDTTLRARNVTAGNCVSRRK